MLSVQVEFLTGRFVAASFNDRDSPEWPPHPARLFSALVATWADSDTLDPAEQAVLEWLEAAGHPTIAASSAFERTPVIQFVPVNDAAITGAWYANAAQHVDDLEDQFERELETSEGEVTKTAQRLLDRIEKTAREASARVDRPGKANFTDAVQLLPERRVRQARVYPSVTVAEPRVTFTWQADATEHLAALDGLLARVTRLGHSSSLVSCRVVEAPPEPSWKPATDGVTLRSVRRGQLRALQEEHERHQASRPRSLPYEPVTYARTTEGELEAESVGVSSALAGDFLRFAFAVGSRRLPATRCVDVARAFRRALFSHIGDGMPEEISGHASDGTPSRKPHLALLPLPYAGFEHSDGRLLGIAVALPESMERAACRAVLRAIGAWERDGQLNVTLGTAGVLRLERLVDDAGLLTLRRITWLAPAREWVSVTPVALPTHPGDLHRGGPRTRANAWARAEEAVRTACRHVSLPEPSEIGLSLDGRADGVPPAGRFPAFRQPGVNGRPTARRLLHVSLSFPVPVAGPVVIGSGRYLGLGLMQPRRERS